MSHFHSQVNPKLRSDFEISRHFVFVLIWKSSATSTAYFYQNQSKLFQFGHFPSIFGQLTIDISGNTAWPQAIVLPKNSPNWSFGRFQLIFDQLKPFICFARHIVKWDFLSDFDTLWHPDVLYHYLFFVEHWRGVRAIVNQWHERVASK